MKEGFELGLGHVLVGGQGVQDDGRERPEMGVLVICPGRNGRVYGR